MAFAQLTWRESLRDIEASLGANPSKLYGMRFRSAIKRSTLSEANERRDWRIWADLAAVLIRRARKIYIGANQYRMNTGFGEFISTDYIKIIETHRHSE
jgi:hypothetical protein